MKHTLTELQALTYVKWQMSTVMISNAVVGAHRHFAVFSSWQ